MLKQHIAKPCLAASTSHVETSVPVGSADSDLGACALAECIAELDRRYAAWLATAPGDAILRTDIPEFAAVRQQEIILVSMPCRSYAQVVSKVQYILGKAEVFDSVSDELEPLLRSLVGLEGGAA